MATLHWFERVSDQAKIIHNRLLLISFQHHLFFLYYNLETIERCLASSLLEVISR